MKLNNARIFLLGAPHGAGKREDGRAAGVVQVGKLDVAIDIGFRRI